MVEKTSDLVFVGHSHREEQRLVDDLEGRSTLYINGGIFQDETAPNICQFKTISFDSATNKVNILSYDWKSSHFECVNNIKEQKIKHKNLKKQFTINEKTEKWLNSVETLIHHSGKDELFLSDIFVYPEIASLSDLKKKERSPILPLDSEKVLVLKDESNKILILGDRKSGKTALLKVLFRRYFEDDKFVPVFLHGSKIKSAAIDVFVKTINSAFVEQYSIDSINNFHALKNEKKVIILDDFDKCKLNSNNTKALLSTVTKYYPNIIMTASSLFEINEFITDDTKDNPIDLYSCFQIEQYSRVQRSHLIENWCYLDDQYTLEEFLTNVDNSKDTINKIFENGYVPRYPFYILTILQTIQQSDPDQLLFSSYGHYYEVLFRNAIGRIVHTNDNIEALFQFLPELAYSCFKKRVKTLSLTEFEAFRKWYCDEYKISPNMHIIFDNDALTKTLIESTMININQGEVKFNAKWVYYFFLARYMASNLEQRVVKDQISSICKRLYRDEFANIVLFLVHHTRNEFVLNEILINSQQLFEEFKPMNLETDIEGINSLIDEIPKLVIEDKDYMKERIKIDQNKDNIETANLENGSDFQNEEEDIIDPSEEILELDLPAKIGVSMRMIEILGLILKNHHSSLKGNTKYVLGNEAFSLALRSMTPIYSLFETNKQMLVNNISSLIVQKGYIDEKRIKSESEKYLFMLCFILAYSFIAFTSESVCNQNLSETFKDIIDKNAKLSYSLLDIAIKLDYAKGSGIPFNDLEILMPKLVSREKTNIKGELTDRRVIHSNLPYRVLVQLVQDYCNLYPVSENDEQRLSSLFDVSMHDQNVNKFLYLKRGGK